MKELFYVLVPLSLLVCYNAPRTGIFVTLAVGFLADPLRKVIAGEPVVLVAIVAVYATVTFAGALRSGLVPPFRRLLARAGKLRGPVTLFFGLVALESGVAMVRTGSPVIAGIGLLAYFAPVPAVLLGYGAARSEQAIRRLIHFYAAFAALFASGIFLSAAGWDMPLLAAVGEDLFVYPAGAGIALRLLCGFFRTSEIAAWHCATAATLLIILAVASRRRLRDLWLAGGASVYFLVAIAFTGRRKAFASILVFGLVFGFLLVRFRRGARTLAVLLLVGGVAAGFAGDVTLFSENFASRYQPYFEREQTATPTNALDRLKQMTVDSMSSILQQDGFFGAGAGTGSQGSQHFGAGTSIVGGSVEGGLGKVLAELGVPGIAILLWIAVILIRRILRRFQRMPRSDTVRANLGLGFLALLAANAIEFVLAHQVYGDPFVLLMLGWILGFLLAVLRPANVKAAPLKRVQVIVPPTVRAPARPIDLTRVGT